MVEERREVGPRRARRVDAVLRVCTPRGAIARREGSAVVRRISAARRVVIEVVGRRSGFSGTTGELNDKGWNAQRRNTRGTTYIGGGTLGDMQSHPSLAGPQSCGDNRACTVSARALLPRDSHFSQHPLRHRSLERLGRRLAHVCKQRRQRAPHPRQEGVSIGQGVLRRLTSRLERWRPE